MTFFDVHVVHLAYYNGNEWVYEGLKGAFYDSEGQEYDFNDGVITVYNKTRSAYKQMRFPSNKNTSKIYVATFGRFYDDSRNGFIMSYQALPYFFDSGSTYRYAETTTQDYTSAKEIATSYFNTNASHNIKYIAVVPNVGSNNGIHVIPTPMIAFQPSARTSERVADYCWYALFSTSAYYVTPDTLEGFVLPTSTPVGPSDPGGYTPDSPSGQTGGQTQEPPVSGLISLPDQPEVSALGSGMMKLYNPTKAQIMQLGAWLWNSGLNLESLKKIFSTPMDVILGLTVVPVSPPTDPAENVIFGNIDSGIQMRPVTSQYMTKNMGSIAIQEYYGNYLDYEPYTKIELFLPYIGSKTLSPDEVMNKTISIDYRIDVLSGACVAFISVDGNVLYQYGGSCSAQIPVTSQNYMGVIQGVLSAVGSVVGGIAGIGTIAGGLIGGVTAPVVAGVGVGAAAVTGAARSVMGAKQRIEHSGGITASTGVVGSQKPYVIVTRPNWCKPGEQPHFTGYPGFFYAKVSQLNGFTQFVNFEFTRVHATDEELEELEDWFINKGVRLPK